MFYTTLKIIHISCAVLSLAGFVLRGIWMLRGSALLQHYLSKRLPHVIDSVLLATAVTMAYLSAQYPLQLNWLTAKLVALIVYILLGMVALRWGQSWCIRFVAWLMAVLVFVYIVLVALTRQYFPFVY